MARSADAGVARAAAEMSEYCENEFDRNERVRQREVFNSRTEEEQAERAPGILNLFTECGARRKRDPANAPGDQGGPPTDRFA